MNLRPLKPTRELTGSWGILGGAFDPIHCGHLTLASDIRKAKELDGVLLVPSYNPPFKADSCRTSWEHRLAMVRLAAEGGDAFAVSAIEAEQNLNGRTLDTVRALKAELPEVSFWFIIGADLLTEFGSWYKPNEILREVPILAGSRPLDSDHESGRHYHSDRIELVPTRLVDVSSTLVRQRVKEGASLETLRALVGEKVARYILSRKLYR